MKLYYFDGCKDEFDVVCHILNWRMIPFTPCENFITTVEYAHGGSCPVLVDGENYKERVLGVGFNGIIKYLNGRGL